ncbi:MAG: hypothetical protein HKN48_11230, partial [Flavobacteriaceae bacterium]|nr:hypothetical protein [Flavobacteriaceae bacterium]
LVNGVANNSVGNSDEAIESLEIGLDFLIDDPTMEKDYFEQLSAAYFAKGNNKKAEAFAKRAAEIKLPN